MVDKVGNYAKYVKEMYWPKVSENKKNEILSILQGMRNPTIRKSASTKKHIHLLSEKYDSVDEGDAKSLNNDESVPNF